MDNWIPALRYVSEKRILQISIQTVCLDTYRMFLDSWTNFCYYSEYLRGAHLVHSLLLSSHLQRYFCLYLRLLLWKNLTHWPLTQENLGRLYRRFRLLSNSCSDCNQKIYFYKPNKGHSIHKIKIINYFLIESFLALLYTFLNLSVPKELSPLCRFSLIHANILHISFNISTQRLHFYINRWELRTTGFLSSNFMQSLWVHSPV